MPNFKKLLRTVKERFARIPVVGKLPEVYGQWQKDDGTLMAAAVAYYAALSFFPLMLVLISGLGLIMQFTQWGADAQEQVLEAIAEYASTEVRDGVATMLNQVQGRASVGGPLGIAGLLFTAVALFAHFDTAFDRIWNIEDRKPKGMMNSIKNLLFHRFRAFMLLLSLGVLILVVFAAGMTVASLKKYSSDLVPLSQSMWWLVESGVSVTLNTAVFMMLYRWLPKVPVHWKEALQGGLLAAVLWEVGRKVLATAVLGDKYSAYGIVGAFIAVMLWIYFASTVVFLGAEYVQAICEKCNLGDSDDLDAEN